MKKGGGVHADPNPRSSEPDIKDKINSKSFPISYLKIYWSNLNCKTLNGTIKIIVLKKSTRHTHTHYVIRFARHYIECIIV